MRRTGILMATGLALGLGLAARAGEVLVKNGDAVAFLGDSITWAGENYAGGYVRLIREGLAANGVDIAVLGAGAGGHKSDDMLARVQKDVIDRDPKPAWMTLSCGVNDVWHGPTGVPLDEYKKNIAALVDKVLAAGIRVMILTSTPVGEEDLNSDFNRQLVGYNDFLRGLAKSKGLPLADLNAAFHRENANPTRPKPPLRYLTCDGVHMGLYGNEVMAEGILRAFGLRDAEMAKARAAWAASADGTLIHNLQVEIPRADYAVLNARAAAAGKPVNDYVSDLLAKAVAADAAKGE